MTMPTERNQVWRSSGTARAWLFALLGLFMSLMITIRLIQFLDPLIIIIISVAFAAIGYVLGSVAFRRYQFCILPDKVLLRNGIVSRNVLELPMARIQGVRIDRTIVEKFLGVGSLKINTAASPDIPNAAAQNQSEVMQLYQNAWIYSVPDFQELADLILKRSESARMAKDVPRMMAASPDPATVRAVQDFGSGIARLFGPAGGTYMDSSVERMKLTFQMSPRMKTVWALETIMPLLVLWAFLWLGLVMLPDLNFLILMMILLLLFVLTAWGYSVANYRNYVINFDDDSFEVIHGVFERNRLKMPYKRIQNINVFSTFFGRMLGLNSVLIDSGAGVAYIHGIEQPDPVVDFLMDQAEDARFDDALGDVSELEDYHVKILELTKKVHYKLKERIGNFDDPFDRTAPEVKAGAFMMPKTKDYLVMSNFLGIGGIYLLVACLILPLFFIFLFPYALFASLILTVIPLTIIWMYSNWYGRNLFRSYKLRFDYDSFYSRFGVWTISDEMIPYRRMQNVYISQSLLQRFYGIRNLTVHAPGVFRTLVGVRDPAVFAAFILRKAEEARTHEAHDTKADIVTEIAMELGDIGSVLKEYLVKTAARRAGA